MKTYYLPLSPDYVAAWGFWEACRELFQNSIDQETKNADSKIVYSHVDEVLTIGSSNCHLPIKSLLFGYSTKRGDDSTIGNFGEGYKLALLVLTRLGYRVRVCTGKYVWSTSFRWSEDYQSEILTIKVATTSTPVNGIFFKVYNVANADMKDIHHRYKPEFQPNTVCSAPKGQIFINGLYVTTVSSLQYAYNFTPSILKLNRDRNMVSNVDVLWETSRIWAKDTNVDSIYQMLKDDVPDVTFYESHTGRQSSQGIVAKYKSESGDAIPYCTQEESNKIERAGLKGQLVTEKLYAALTSACDFSFSIKMSLPDRLQQFKTDYVGYLPQAGVKELDIIVKAICK